MAKKSFLSNAAGSNGFWYVVGGVAVVGAIYIIAQKASKKFDEKIGELGDAAEDVGEKAMAAVESTASVVVDTVTNGNSLFETLVFGPLSIAGVVSRFINLGGAEMPPISASGGIYIKDMPWSPEIYGLRFSMPDGHWYAQSSNEEAIYNTLVLLEGAGYLAEFDGAGRLRKIQLASRGPLPAGEGEPL